MKNRHLGQEAMEFVLIGVLIFMAAFFTTMLFSGKIADFFHADSAAVKAAKNKPGLISKNTSRSNIPDYLEQIPSSHDASPLYSLPVTTTADFVAGGSLNGTLENPAFVCNEGKCIMDVGNFALSGIPEDFNTYVKASGSASTTLTMVDYIEQIAKQLESEGKLVEADQVRILANMGHNLAGLEETIEATVNACNRDSACIQQAQNQPVGEILNYDSSLYQLPSSLTLKDALAQIHMSYYYDSGANKNTFGNKMAEHYEAILDEPGIDDSMKGVIQELMWDMGVIAEDLDDNVYSFWMNYNTDGTVNHAWRDPLEGANVGNTITKAPDLNFETYDASKITNFDSSLICAATKGSDTGKKCHKYP
jgi:hypothetical protein